MILRLTFKNLAANKVRFAMTTFAVVLAVAFVVSSFVLTDGLRSTFGDLSEEIVDGTDLEVRPVSEFGDPVPLDASVIDTVADIDGIRTAVARVEAPENAIRPIKPNGEEITSFGPPQLAFSWIDDEQLSGFDLVAGEAPTDSGEFAMDLDAAATNGFELGQSYDIVTPSGRTEATLVGTTSFGEDNDTLGATLMHFPVDDLQQLIARPGYDAVSIALDDPRSIESVRSALETALPATEVLDNASLEAEQRAEFNEGIDIIGTVLLGFAGVSVFVSIFIIANTFSIVLSQRTRELALLRTVGADPQQLRRSVQAEALVIGAMASALGIAAGVGVAYGLRGLFNAIGASLPESPLVISGRTIVVAALVGVLVTFVAAIGPARRASRVPAIAALREDAGREQARGRRKLAVGAGLLALGLTTGAIGLFGGLATAPLIAMLAIGAMSVFLAATLLSPALVRPVTRVLGLPLEKLAGMPGRLALGNSSRNTHRTASTAAALMIGLALVSMALVVGESVKAQLRSTLATSVQADYLVTENTDAGLPAVLADDLAASPVTTDVAAFTYDEARIGDEVQDVVAADHQAVAALFDLGIVEGRASAADVANPVLISDDEADSLGLAVGAVVPVEFSNGAAFDLTVIGVFSDDVIIEEDYLLAAETWVEAGADPTVSWLALGTTDADQASIDAALAAIEGTYPQALVDTANEFVDRLEGFVDQALAALNILVALAVIIALIGIANTLALSVFERTRELGLLRAVGMSRRQLRRMVRYEAALVATFGAALGVAVGVGFGWAAVVALPASVTSTLAVPTGRIALLMAVAAIAGLVAAWGPARRAGRLDVLDAISS